MTWKDKAAKLLLAFYNTIEPATDSSDMFKKAWQNVGDGSVYYDQNTLVTAIECLLENKVLEDNYSQTALSSMIANRLTTVFAKEPDQIQTRIDLLIRELSNGKPETMNVFMSIQGVSFSQRMKIGEFEFIPAKEFDSLDLQFRHENERSHFKNNVWKDQNHVMVSVEACDPGKAREKAYTEFQWLENAIRLFIGSNHYDIGITSFINVSIEHSFVSYRDGAMLGSASKAIGPLFLLPLENIFYPDSPFYCVIDKLGRKQNELTELQRRIRHAVYLGGLSVCETVPEIAYFLCVSAFETLFHAETDKYVSPSIAQQIVETFCFLIADEDKRRKTFEQMRPFYGKRSAVAHGGKTKVTHKDIRLVQAYLRGAVLKLVNDPTLSTLKTMDDISNLVRDRKFGV